METVLIERTGKVGYITLNRPRALNSLTLDMIRRIHAAIKEHESNTDVEVIVIRSSEKRAFCAGGDMKVTRDMALAENWQGLRSFFAEEYALNLHISECVKPYVSLVPGIAMGGGLGLTVHGSVMVVSDSTKLAMPETAIGFFPDVGGTHFLSRLPCKAGLWLGFTGVPISGQEAVALGLATHFIDETYWSDLCEQLEQQGAKQLSKSLNTMATRVEAIDTGGSGDQYHSRAAWFSADTDSELLRNLTDAAAEHQDAEKLLKRMHSVSPYAVSYTRKLLKKAATMSLKDCLAMELEAADEMVRHPDFIEGIRAVLVDKDKAIWTSSYPV